MGGVFDLWPNLEVLLVGGGATWIPTFLWRCDYQYHAMPGVEAPWMTAPPSAYFVDHFKVATHGLEDPEDPAQLQAFLNVVPNMSDMLMYTSCYPNTDYEEPAPLAARVPSEWHQKVFHDNALAFYGWADRPARPETRVAVADLRERR
jgi:predicted TIM-barrel fold metal-dependent hydrolase